MQFSNGQVVHISRQHRASFGLTSVENPPVQIIGWLGLKGRRQISTHAVILNGARVEIPSDFLRTKTPRELRRLKGSRLDRKRRRFGKSLNKKG